MVLLQDFTGLRRQEKVSVRLNGVNYHCAPELPGGVMLDMATMRAELAPLAADVAAAEEAGDDVEPEQAERLASVGGSSFERMNEFIETVMEPDSYEQWQRYLRPPPAGLTPAKRREHAGRVISLSQMVAVFEALLGHYTGRPTSPSSTSSNGDGGTGGKSMGSARGKG